MDNGQANRLRALGRGDSKPVPRWVSIVSRIALVLAVFLASAFYYAMTEQTNTPASEKCSGKPVKFKAKQVMV